MATENVYSVNSKITLNNEKFTHLLSLRGILQTKTFAEIDQFCKNNLLQTFDNNHKLLLDVLFHGMHKMLHNIDMKIINKFRDKMPAYKTKKIKINIKDSNKNDIEKDTNAQEKTPVTFSDIPYDVMKYCISTYLDISTLISLEKVSKLFFSRSRDASISLFHFHLTKFFSYKNVSHDLLRFKNTKKLSIVVENDNQYGIYTHSRDNEWDDYTPTIELLDGDDEMYKNDKNDTILHKQLSYFRKQSEWPFSIGDPNANSVKFTSDKLNLILSQFKKYQNFEWLKFQYTGWSETSIINKVMQNIPMLQVKVLELVKVDTQFIFAQNSMNNIKQLRLTHVNFHLDSFQIMNDHMNNLETVYLDSVSIIKYDKNVSKICIDKMLMRLKHLIFNDPYTASAISDGLSLEGIICKLFVNGVAFTSDDYRAVSCRKNLQVLHCHCHNAVKTICESAISVYANLNRLCIDCKKNNGGMVMKIISKCPTLHYLSLIIHPEFVTAGDNMKDFFDSFMLSHQCIKSLRIKELTQTLSYSNESTPFHSPRYGAFKNVYSENSFCSEKHVSSPFIVSFAEYVKNVSTWKKLSTFQFISCKKLESIMKIIEAACKPKLSEVLSFNVRKVKHIGDLEEFQILNCIKDIVTDELLLTFIGIDSNEFSKCNGLSKLYEVCKKDYRIKICGSSDCDKIGWETQEQFKEDKCIKIQIGKWNDKFHQQQFGDFDKWKHDCSRIHF